MKRKDPGSQRLSVTQLAALRLIAERKVEIVPFDTIPMKGSPVARTTLWSLLDRELVVIHGWWANGKAKMGLTAFGKQILEWSNQ